MQVLFLALHTHMVWGTQTEHDANERPIPLDALGPCPRGGRSVVSSFPVAAPRRYRPVSNLTESVCLVATLPVQDWVICAPAAFLPCGTPWVGVHLWQTRYMPVLPAHKGTRAPTGYPERPLPIRANSSTLHG